jgi:hypothetical protein
MNMYRTHFATAILMVFVGCAAAGQNGPQEPRGQEAITYFGTSQVRNPALRLYEDKKDGFQFKYPSFLYQDYAYHILNIRPCNDLINVEVSLSAVDPKPDPHLGNDVTVETQVVNNLKWVHYSSLDGAQYCANWSHEQVCFKLSTWVKEKPLSSAIIEAMQVIESTFVFSLPDRMDSRIATAKMGDKIGSLRVRRVITREMAELNPKKYGDGYYGRIDFTGTLTLTGSMEDFRTMNSGPDWEFSCDGASCTRLPFGLGEDTLSRVIFTRWSTLADRQMSHAPPPRFGSLDVTIVVKNLSVTSYPGQGASFANADLVSMVVNR